jgi:hypothetical protein
LRNRRPEEVDIAPEERIPVFTTPLGAPIQAEQGDRIHLTAKYEPVSGNFLFKNKFNSEFF